MPFKKSLQGRADDRFPRRERHQPAAAPGAHLVAARPDAGLAVLFQLEDAVSRGRGDLWNFHFHLHPGSIRAPQVVEFLGALRRQVRGPLLVIWDRLPLHRSALVRRSVEASRGRPGSCRPMPRS
jgi:hypothetical protein